MSKEYVNVFSTFQTDPVSILDARCLALTIAALVADPRLTLRLQL